MTPSAMFVRGPRGAFTPTEASIGPWDESVLHGGPVAGLLAHATRQVVTSEWRPTRLTVDLLKPVPARDLSLQAETIRDGKRLRVIDARVLAEHATVARATAVFTMPTEDPPEALLQSSPTISQLADAEPASLPREPIHHANCIDLRRGARGAYWIGISLDLVDGAPIDPFERAATASDWANPAANMRDGSMGFINADVTLYLHRPPVGEWIGVGSVGRNSCDGVAISDCEMVDAVGLVGRCMTASLATVQRARPPGASAP